MVDQVKGRLTHYVPGLGGGINLSAVLRTLQGGQTPHQMNVRSRSEGVVPVRVPNGTFEFSTDEAIRYAFVYDADVSLWLVMLGTTKCWVTDGGAPVEKTPTVPFTSATDIIWFGHTVISEGVPVAIVNNGGLDSPHYWDSGAGLFLPIPSAPKMRTCIGYLGRLWGGFIYDVDKWYANRMAWSLDGDVTNWSAPYAGWKDLPDAGDPILAYGRLPGNILLVYRRKSISACYPLGDPYEPVGIQPLASRGLWAPMSLQELETSHIFLGYDDVYIATTGSLQPVGAPIREDLFRLSTPATLRYAWSFNDKTRKEYYLVTKVTGGGRRAWIFNYERGVWSQQNLATCAFLVSWFKL